MRPKLALQTITWGDDQHYRFADIFAAARAAEFDGVEVGYRRLAHRTPAEVAALLAEHRLTLFACHVGGNLKGPAQARAEGDTLDEVLDFIVPLRVPFLLYSGLRGVTDDAAAAEVDHLNEAAERCEARRIRLLYHNHHWEFANGAQLWRLLLKRAAGALGFAPDVGWATRAGVDVGGLLAELGSRVGVIHFKDFASQGPEMDTVTLGSGIVDFGPVWDFVRVRGEEPPLLVAEQDYAPDAAAAARLNGAYLSRHAQVA